MRNVSCILHPTDFSAHANEAFQAACDLAHLYGARLVVLHVHHAPVGIAGIVPIAVPSASGETQEEEQLQRLQPTDPNQWIERRVETGDPRDVILSVARECGCDLIVMGTHGRTGIQRALMGSVADHVSRHAACTVLMANAPSSTAMSANSEAG